MSYIPLWFITTACPRPFRSRLIVCPLRSPSPETSMSNVLLLVSRLAFLSIATVIDALVPSTSVVITFPLSSTVKLIVELLASAVSPILIV